MIDNSQQNMQNKTSSTTTIATPITSSNPPNIENKERSKEELSSEEEIEITKQHKRKITKRKLLNISKPKSATKSEIEWMHEMFKFLNIYISQLKKCKTKKDLLEGLELIQKISNVDASEDFSDLLKDFAKKKNQSVKDYFQLNEQDDWQFLEL